MATAWYETTNGRWIHIDKGITEQWIALIKVLPGVGADEPLCVVTVGRSTSARVDELESRLSILDLEEAKALGFNWLKAIDGCSSQAHAEVVSQRWIALHPKLSR